MRKDFPAPRGYLTGVDSHHDALRSVLGCRGAHKIGIRHGGGVDADFIGSRAEHALYVGQRADATPNGQRDENLRGDGFDHLH